MDRSGRFLVLACLVVAGSLTACSSSTTDDGASQRPVESTSPSAALDQSSPVVDPPVLLCQRPDPSIVSMTKTAIAPHPGPVRGATLVRAAKTGTGTWYVVGIDRAYAMDDGSLSGRASRSVALTNAPGGGVNFIPLGAGVAHRPFATSWDRVSWTGSRLAAGQRALRKAITCLDESADKS